MGYYTVLHKICFILQQISGISKEIYSNRKNNLSCAFKIGVLYKITKQNFETLSSNESKALTNLTKQEDIIIQKANKGNIVVILEKSIILRKRNNF